MLRSCDSMCRCVSLCESQKVSETKVSSGVMSVAHKRVIKCWGESYSWVPAGKVQSYL